MTATAVQQWRALGQRVLELGLQLQLTVTDASSAVARITSPGIARLDIEEAQCMVAGAALGNVLHALSVETWAMLPLLVRETSRERGNLRHPPLLAISK